MKNKLPKDERTLWAMVRGLFALIAVLFIVHGFIIKPHGAGSLVDLEFVWDALHPASIVNIIGVILFFALILGLSGLWKLFVSDYYADLVSDWIGWVFLSVGVLGILLMFI